MHDEALLVQWQASGDADAFRTLTQRYGRMVYAAALRVLRNPTDAEDVAQDCFEKLAGARRAPERYLGPWLHRMAVNRALDRLRVEAARKRREVHFAEAKPFQEAHEWSDIYPLVDEAIDTLPDKLRRVLVAHYLEGLTHEAIAERESVTRSAVTQRIQRGLEQVRAQLRRKGVIAPAAGIFAGMLGENMAQAAAIPIGLAENLGRISLAGPLIEGTGVLASIASFKYLAMGLSVLVIAVGAVVVYSNVQTPPPVNSYSEPAAREAPSASAGVAEPLSSANTSTAVPSGVGTVGRLAAVATPEDTVIRGRVLDEDTGHGIEGVTVKLLSQDARVDTATDPEGAYRFESIAPGTYHVACGRINGYYVPLERRAETRSEYMREVAPGAGQTLEVAGFRFGRGEAFTGKVIDEEGRPVAGALVTGRTEVNAFRITNTVPSADDGTFTVTGFPSTNGLYAWAEKDQLVSSTSGPYSIPENSPNEVSITLYPEAVVRGVVVDEFGNPLPGMKVVPQFSMGEAYREREAVSDRKGCFELTGMFADSMWMRVCRDVEIINDPIPTLVLAPGEIVENLELVCKIGALEIAGVVVDMRGNPIPRARIECRGNGLDLQPWADGEGRFTVGELQAGFYTLTAEHEAHLSVTQKDITAGSTAVRIVMGDPITVTGRVIDAATGRLVIDHKIMWANSPEYIRLSELFRPSETDDGTFRLRISRLGSVRIAARAKGYLLGYADVQAEEGMAPIQNLEIALKAQADLAGYVRDATGKAVPGALIFSGVPERPMDDDFASCRSARNGSFVLPAHELGHECITVTHPEFPRVLIQLTSAHFAGEPIDVRFPDGATLECTVLQDGVPVKAFVSAVPAAYDGRNPSFTNAQTAEDGTCTLRGLPAGECRVNASLPSEAQMVTGGSIETRLTVEAGAVVPIEFQFRSGSSTLSGVFQGIARSLRVTLEIPAEQGEQRYHIFRNSGVKTGDPFGIPNLPSGPAILTLSWSGEDGGHHIEQEVVLTEGASTEVNLDLDALAASSQDAPSEQSSEG
ncbi:MAG: sigma-70 family RNA polymerase sigma factor [Candidatus Hydrogenedentes bacterium]|nr:sigma-70 family RNA polymerase sigma factor [Candidatus Hydrogenedentota bacterium]